MLVFRKILRRYLMDGPLPAKSRPLFSQKAASQMFGRFLNTFLSSEQIYVRNQQ